MNTARQRKTNREARDLREARRFFLRALRSATPLLERD